MRLSHVYTPLWGVCWFLAIAALVLAASPGWAQTPTVTRIEEDWELVIGTPSPTSDAPQVTCTMAPVDNVDAHYATFMVNHHDTPSFSAGGLQVQAWNGLNLLASKRYPDRAILTLPGETIRWTQVMTIDTEGLVFEVVGGVSTTWGAFGGEGTLKLVTPTQLTSLQGYSPDVSVRHSGVSYAANRVQSLVLKRVRAYGAAGLIGEDDTPRVVHSLSQ